MGLDRRLKGSLLLKIEVVEKIMAVTETVTKVDDQMVIVKEVVGANPQAEVLIVDVTVVVIQKVARRQLQRRRW